MREGGSRDSLPGKGDRAFSDRKEATGGRKVMNIAILWSGDWGGFLIPECEEE